MNSRRRLPLTKSTVLIVVNALIALVAATPSSPVYSQSKDIVRALSMDLYQFAYPIVLMEETMKQATAVPNASTIQGRAPINQFAYFRTYPDASDRDVVRFNFDTLYSFAWVDLSSGPVILTVPDTGSRYYLVPTLDMWTDVFSSLGTRTTGNEAGNFAYVPPGWEGELPEGIERIHAPTSMIWVMGRIQTNGPSDYENVHKVQDGLRLTPLNQWGKDYQPPATSPVDATVDTKTPPLVTTNKMDGVEMLTRLARLLKKYPPHPNDYPIIFRMRELGLVPGRDWDPKSLNSDTLEAINAGAKDGLEDMIAGVRQVGKFVNGWNIAVDNIGTYGTSYRQRAVVALAGLGANLPADAIYPGAVSDTDGKPLDGTKKYVLHFDKGQTPPTDAFWSITMYDQQGFQVANPINRYAIGDRDKLHFNEDGSLDIYIQSASPGSDKEANWLPAAPEGELQPTMRIYAPKASALNGTWVPPAIKLVE